ELGRIHRPVHLAPRDVRVARRLSRDELVVGGAARVRAGAADERTFGGNDPLLPPHCRFVQRGHREIPEHPTSCDPLVLEPAGTLNVGAHRALLKYAMPVTYENPAIVLCSIGRVNKMPCLR